MKRKVPEAVMQNLRRQLLACFASLNEAIDLVEDSNRELDEDEFDQRLKAVDERVTVCLNTPLD